MLEELLSSRTRAEILRILFGVSDEERYLRAIERESGLSVRAVQKELRKLLKLGLLLERRSGNRVYFRANREHPLFPELHRLVLKTSGLAERIRQALMPLPVEVAFIFGSAARGSLDALSDIDLLIVGQTSLREVASVLGSLRDDLGREVNPVVFDRQEFDRRRDSGDAFVTRILQNPKIFVVGNPNELGAVGR